MRTKAKSSKPARIAGLLTLAAVALASLAVAQATRRFEADDPLWMDPDKFDTPRPAESPALALYDIFENTFQDRGDPDWVRAENINTLGEVPDSSWFNNRLGRRDMGIDEITRGPNRSGGPASGTWTIIGRPTAGITPKFLIEDADGVRFILKFDPVDYPEMASAAEMICQKFFHAAGYNVPENYILTMTPNQLEIAPGALYTDWVGDKVPITEEDVDFWMSNAPVNPDGTTRVLASRFVDGEHVGEFRFYGTRSDDPNDIFPHENRRELRGYRVFSAWLNHDDSRALNTYDSYVVDEETGNHYIRHYLLDFGSCLGSASVMPNLPRGGYEYFVDMPPSMKTLGTFGIWVRPWLRADYPDYPAAGNVEADFFEPWNWRPEYTNAAFDRMDAADAFWAARIAARFSDEAVRAIVETGEITDRATREYLAEVIMRRRDKVVDYWITRTNPLDGFQVSGTGDSMMLRWDNAATRVAAASPTAFYTVAWSSLDNDNNSGTAAGIEPVGQSPAAVVPASAWGPADTFGYRYAVARISTSHEEFPAWRKAVVVTLRDRGGRIDVVGIQRPRQAAERAQPGVTGSGRSP